MGVGNAIGAGRQVKDFNVKGSAWIAKDSGQMVKFQYDTIYSFSNGENETIHYDGAVSKKLKRTQIQHLTPHYGHAEVLVVET